MIRKDTYLRTAGDGVTTQSYRKTGNTRNAILQAKGRNISFERRRDRKVIWAGIIQRMKERRESKEVK